MRHRTRATGSVPIWLLLFSLAAAAQAQGAELAEAIAACQAGDPRALAALRRHPDAAAAALLADLARNSGNKNLLPAELDLQALRALGVATPQVFAGLQAALEHNSDAMRVRVLRAIGDLAPDAVDPGTLSRWLEQLPAGQAQVVRIQVQGFAVDGAPVRFQGAIELERIRTRLSLRDEKDPQRLQLLVADQDIDTAELAAQRLGGLGLRAEPALEAIADLMRARTVNIGHRRARDGTLADLPRAANEYRQVAAEAITRIAPSSELALQAHAVLLQSGTPPQCLESLVALRLHPEVDDATVQAVIGCLDRKHHRVLRREALVTLSTFGPRATRATPSLHALARGDDEEFQKLAQSALRAIGK